MNSVIQLVVELFRSRLADMDVILDPIVLHLMSSRSRLGRSYPGFEHATLQEALDGLNAREPCRRSYRTPLTVAEMDASVLCMVSRTPPAYSLPRLDGKFIQQV
ncbi:uncharacterized protein IUM83_11964 [Phytophthora cinnamomi]|uniref:uncharacterized protein n=1 Tax=Phytophthora cinnamomi TaxID=4785 RepID=UPI003559C6EC|nr:hypothetical protein IUM83_11964 [Phytophthora cinnamomi]